MYIIYSSEAKYRRPSSLPFYLTLRKVSSIFPSPRSDHIRKCPHKPSERHAHHIKKGAFYGRPAHSQCCLHRLHVFKCVKQLQLTNRVEPLQLTPAGGMLRGIGCVGCVLFFFNDGCLGCRGLTDLWHLLSCTGQRVEPWSSNIHRLGLFLQPTDREYHRLWGLTRGIKYFQQLSYVWPWNRTKFIQKLQTFPTGF